MSDAGRKKDDIPAPAYEPDPKIYYIRNADCKPAAPKKPRKKAKRKPDLAFKNIKARPFLKQRASRAVNITNVSDNE